MTKFSFILLMIVYTITVGFVGYRVGTRQNMGMCITKCSLAMKAMNIVWPITSKITFVIGESPCQKICALTEMKDASIFESVGASGMNLLEGVKHVKSSVCEKVKILKSDVSSYLLKYNLFNKNFTN